MDGEINLIALLQAWRGRLCGRPGGPSQRHPSRTGEAMREMQDIDVKWESLFPAQLQMRNIIKHY